MFEFVSSIINKFVGNKYEKDISEVAPLVELIKEKYEAVKDLSNDELRAKTASFRTILTDKYKTEAETIAVLKEELDTNYELDFSERETKYNEIDELEERSTELVNEGMEEILPEAFAVMKETAKRFTENEKVEVTATDFDREIAAERESVEISGDKAYWNQTWLAAGIEVKWDMIHYDVQLIGGVILHQGKIAEMATGEGKTLVATLPLYLNALTGRGVHVVTVNDYLARRDSEWMGPLFEFHGLSIDCIDKHEANSDERRAAYNSDITYGTNNEFGFDYLRDNMAARVEDLVQRKHSYAIVDEVDSVLIDDARTPLIISGPTPKGDKHEFNQLKPKVEKIVNAQRTYVNTVLAEAKKLLASIDEDITDKKEHNKKLEDGGMSLLRSFRGLPKNKALIKYLSEPGIRAFLQKTENRFMQDNSKEMPKVDEELFFVIDEKNNSIELTDRGIDLMTDDADDTGFFVLPDIGGMVAEIDKSDAPVSEKVTKKEEMIRDYSIKSERIHTVNQLLKAYTLFEIDVEYVIMDNKVKIVDEQTGRIMDGRRYSDGLHQAIEAKENVKIEASSQTWASVTLQNYFRMYDKLSGMTGTAETEAGELWEIYKLDVVVIPTNRPIVRDDREDLVYKTVREKYSAVIEEIVELTKAGRPVLVGTTSVEVSELLGRMLKMKNIKHNILNAKLHKREADIVAEAGFAGTVTIATNMAGRGTDIKLGPGVKDAGGLAIVGTERHESRRVDRQLRGRAGRQGDPGSTQFFVSLEDNLMRLFGSERIAKLMDRMGLEEGEVIQHSMITKSIERAQKKVEENHFGVRKRLLEYDDVMNSQREVIYTKRRYALYGQRLRVELSNSMYDLAEGIVEDYQEGVYEEFEFEVIKTMAIESPVDAEEFAQIEPNELVEKIHESAISSYSRKSEVIAASALPVITDVYENQSATYTNIVIPFTDGIKTMQVVAELEKSYKSKGRELVLCMEKGVTLAVIDEAWREHLREMDELKQSVQQAVYEQKDPLLIYKFESFELFNQMIRGISKDVISFVAKANLPIRDSNDVKDAGTLPRNDQMNQAKTSRTDSTMSAPQREMEQAGGPPESNRPKPQPVRADKKVGRNDPCPCGSGKKFKQCHGKVSAPH